MKRKLVIVQNKPTQFDVPLFAMMDKLSDLELTVFYTDVHPGQNGTIDGEIGIVPRWDYLRGLRYNAFFNPSPISLWRQILSLYPDHVIICGWYPRSHAVLTLLLRFSGVQLGVRSDNTLEHTSLTGFQGLLKRVFIGVWPSIFEFWHPVGTLAQNYLELLSWKRRPVHFFPYAVDVDWFICNAAKFREKRAEIREQLGLYRDDRVVLGLMKWSAREDPLTLVEAFIHEIEFIPHLKLLLVGDGELSVQVMALLQSYPERSVTPGYLSYSELPKYYSVSDIFVHPAINEPFGVSVQEAMSCGLPVLASNGVGSAVDFIVPDVKGDVFQAGQVSQLASLLRKWLSTDKASQASKHSVNSAMVWSYQRTLNEFNACIADS